MDIYFISLDIFDENGSRIVKNTELKNIQHNVSEDFSKKILIDVYKNNSEIIRKNSKPFVKDNSLFLSISHSNSFVAIAFDKNEIGIDIEMKKPRNYNEILKYFGINNNENIDQNEFFKIWTTYEAEYKSGIQESILSFEYKNYICTVSSKSNETPKIYETEIPKKELLKYKNNTNNSEISDFLPIECKFLPPAKIKLKTVKNS